jgi:hypothetical protein|tara:strand:+ start:2409 stop:2765 length:357 start_codon:yes stop_codon:yes gene_type:complete
MANEILYSILFLLVFTTVLIFIFDWYRKKSLKKLIENYDGQENESRREPEEERKRETGIKTADGSSDETEPVVPRPDESERRELLQTTTTDSVGENQPKFINKLRRTLKRLREKRKEE